MFWVALNQKMQTKYIKVAEISITQTGWTACHHLMTLSPWRVQRGHAAVS